MIKQNNAPNDLLAVKTSFGKQAAAWLSMQVGAVGFTEAAHRFGISRQSVQYAWRAIGLGKTPREKIKTVTESEDLVDVAAARRARRRAYMRDYNARKDPKLKRLYNQQWYQDHKEQAKAASRQYRSDNLISTRKAQARWRESNKERMLEYNKAYQAQNKERVARKAREKRLAFFSEDPKAAWLLYTFQAARGRAKRRGLPYDKELSGLVLPDLCPVLGIPLQYQARRKYPASDSPSLDRLIPQRGYVLSNLRVISWRANVLKRDASIDEVSRVLAYMKECLALEEQHD